MKKILTAIAALLLPATLSAQDFLSINPDVRTSAMGDVSAAVTGDAWSVYGNAAAPLLGYADVEVQLSYTPWQRARTGGYALWSAGGYVGIGRRHLLLFGGRMYSEPKLTGGDYPFIPKDEDNNPLPMHVTRPNSKALDLGYGCRLTDNLALAVTAGYVHAADGTGGTNSALGFGISLFGTVPLTGLTDGAKLDLGVKASNLGFAVAGGRYSLPATAKAGASLCVPVTDAHVIEAAFDAGYLYQSKAVNTFTAGIGAEYTLMQLVKVRAGYGYRHYGYGTFGLGLRFMHIQLDASYWLAAKNCPWRNTFGIGVGVEF